MGFRGMWSLLGFGLFELEFVLILLLVVGLC